MFFAHYSRLFSIASSSTEVNGVRGQALLAMSDLSLLFENMMSECETLGDEEKVVSFEGLLEEFLDSGSPPMIIIAAEICSKLMMRGRITSTSIMSKLLMVFFDPKIAQSWNDEGDVLLSVDDANEEAEAAR